MWDGCLMLVAVVVLSWLLDDEDVDDGPATILGSSGRGASWALRSGVSE